VTHTDDDVRPRAENAILRPMWTQSMSCPHPESVLGGTEGPNRRTAPRLCECSSTRHLARASGKSPAAVALVGGGAAPTGLTMFQTLARRWRGWPDVAGHDRTTVVGNPSLADRRKMPVDLRIRGCPGAARAAFTPDSASVQEAGDLVFRVRLPVDMERRTRVSQP
jgi:hypothetical protein